MEIRDSQLYRDTHATFEDYCQDAYGFGERRGRQLMSAAEIGTIVPTTNEAQARELAPLRDQPEEMAAALSEASAEGKPTAAKVREAVRRRIGVPIVPGDGKAAPAIVLPTRWSPKWVAAITRARNALATCDPGALKELDVAIERARQLEAERASEDAGEPRAAKRGYRRKAAPQRAKGCTFDTPRGCKCKLCGKVH